MSLCRRYSNGFTNSPPTNTEKSLRCCQLLQISVLLADEEKLIETTSSRHFKFQVQVLNYTPNEL